MWWINQDCQSVPRFWLSGNIQYDRQVSIYCDRDEDDEDGGGYDYDDCAKEVSWKREEII